MVRLLEYLYSKFQCCESELTERSATTEGVRQGCGLSLFDEISSLE